MNFNNPIPFKERKTNLRGLLELATGSYPAFLFGGNTGRILPVFHFHDVTPDYLEPYLRHLAQNNWRTVTSEALTNLARNGVHPGTRTVALCFDDAWASLWTVACPLLKRYDMTAITYVIPSLTLDAASTRPQNVNIPPGSPPLATWPELRAMQNSGVIDVQAHALTHAMIFCHDRLTGFATPDYNPAPLAAPLLEDTPPRFVSAAEPGTPLYPQRSRCSDARRFFPDTAGVNACRDYVKNHGEADYFRQPSWPQPLRDIMQRAGGRWEAPEETQRAINHEVAAAREIINARLQTGTVRQICFPWAVAGNIAEEAARKSGYTSAIADRFGGRHAVGTGDNPYRLMRLKHNFIFALPGQPRKNFFQLRKIRRPPVQ